jgi:hypothetical protein
MTIWLGLRVRGGQCARGLRAGTPDLIGDG